MAIKKKAKKKAKPNVKKLAKPKPRIGKKVKKAFAAKRTKSIKVAKPVKITKPKAVAAKKAPKEKMNQIWCDKLLRDPRVRKWLVQTVGENAIHVIQEFDVEMSDEDISKKSEIRPSDVRVVLNRLHSHGLASYSRSRDKNSGWYSYVWKLDSLHAQELADEMDKLDRMGAAQEATDVKEYYYCPDEGVKVKFLFEAAAANNFRCANCGASLKYLEPSKEAK